MNEDIAHAVKELESTLAKFKVDDIKQYALKDFPALNWAKITDRIENCHEKLNSQTVASVIASLVRNSEMSIHEIDDINRILQLRMYGLSTKRTWFAYELINRDPNFGKILFKDIAQCIGRSVKAKAFAIRGPHNYDSILVSLTPKKRPTIVCISDNYLFVSPKTHNTTMLEKIAKAIGCDSIKNGKLSGCSIPSLEKILNKRKGATHLNAVKSKAIYRPRPKRMRRGLDLTTGESMRTYLQDWLGDEENATCLQNLTLQTVAPFRDGEIFTRAVLSSANVENSLRDMAMADIASPTSLFFLMLTEHCKNDLKVRIS